MRAITEAEVLAACAIGEVLDCADGSSRRTLNAGLIRRCCHELKDQVDPRGLRLHGAAIAGAVDLNGLDVPFPLRFDDCEFDSPVLVEGAQLYELALTGCAHVPGLLANGVRVSRDLDLSRSQVTGAHRTSASESKQSAIWLCEAAIGGRFLCVDTVVDGSAERSIQADRLQVGGNIRLLHAFTARGEVRLIGARIGGSLDLTGARIESSLTGLALDLGDAVIDGSVFLIGFAGRDPVIRGRIDMGRVRIGGQFLVRNATLEGHSVVPVGSAYSRARLGGVALSGPRMSVGAEMTLEGSCRVAGSIDLSMSELSNLSIGQGCSLLAPGRTALDLSNAEILSDVYLGRTVKVEGTTRLTGTRIRGRLILKGAVLTAPEGKTLVAAQSAVIDGDADLQEMQATGGRLRFSNATLGGLIAVGARLVNPDGFTLSLHQATVRGSVILVGGFRSEGLLSLDRATIEGRLECGGGTFTCPGATDRNAHGHAIRAISATVRGGMHLEAFTVWPSLDFTNASTTFLVDDPVGWPPRFVISGFTYDRFEQPPGASSTSAWDQRARCAWLERLKDYDAGPYEQAARVFRQHGYGDGATSILIAQRRRARREIAGRWARSRRVVDAAFSAAVGYGYRPVRVLWLVAALLALVTGSLAIPAAQASLRASSSAGRLYTTHGPLSPRRVSAGTGLIHDDACGGGQVRCFNAFLYAVDTVIPLVSLDQRATWYPDSNAPYGALMQWWLDVANVLGWLLSSIFVLALAGLARLT